METVKLSLHYSILIKIYKRLGPFPTAYTGITDATHSLASAKLKPFNQKPQLYWLEAAYTDPFPHLIGLSNLAFYLTTL